MTTPADDLAAYVPGLVRRQLARRGGEPTVPFADSLPGAALFVDISGPTALAERLATRATTGAEELSALFNAYFGHLIELIAAHGGDVMQFAGDGLLALWAAEGDDAELGALCRRAAQSGRAIQATLHEYRVADGIRLSSRMIAPAPRWRWRSRSRPDRRLWNDAPIVLPATAMKWTTMKGMIPLVLLSLLLLVSPAAAQPDVPCCICEFCGTNLPNICFSGTLDDTVCARACESVGCVAADTSSEPCSTLPGCDVILSLPQVPAPALGSYALGAAVLLAALAGMMRQIRRRRAAD